MRMKMSGAVVCTAAGVAAAVLVSLGVSATAGESAREAAASVVMAREADAPSTTRAAPIAPPADHAVRAAESVGAPSGSAAATGEAPDESSEGAVETAVATHEPEVVESAATTGEPATGSAEPTKPTAEPTQPTDSATPRERWLAQQELVRQCMNDQGFDYLYYEWWNPVSQTGDFSSPAMPKNLTTEEEAAWKLALDGETGGGADYHWEDAGCWGTVVHQLGISS